MDIAGYCIIKKDATSGNGAINPQEFIGERVRVMEFGIDGSVTVLNNQSSALCMFDKEDIKTSFRCKLLGEYVLPIGLDFTQELVYSSLILSRKGGYPPILREMVIQSSLMKGKFNDWGLWELQDHLTKQTIKELQKISEKHVAQIIEKEQSFKPHKTSTDEV